jgi:hypothetical protein
MPTLEQDYTTVPGQLFSCLSIVGPDCPQKTDKFGIKIRGCFSTREEAASHAKRLQSEDATFDIYVVDMYKWLLIPPDKDHIEDVHYADKKLEELMQGYKENQNAARREFENRKKEAMEVKSPIAEGDEMPYLTAGDENSKFYSKPGQAPDVHPADVLEDIKKEHPDLPLEEQVKLADERTAELNKKPEPEEPEEPEEPGEAVAACAATGI